MHPDYTSNTLPFHQSMHKRVTYQATCNLESVGDMPQDVVWSYDHAQNWTIASSLTCQILHALSLFLQRCQAFLDFNKPHITGLKMKDIRMGKCDSRFLDFSFCSAAFHPKNNVVIHFSPTGWHGAHLQS